ncbi:hypothetical protein E3P92_01385 [Wallemia ichthyophaga]|nr:hypothetical protein E3P91_01094 [Wallemia ichthyophaga]TIA82759.1 hypothetical protein E3P98_01156 [Wallemia ichthyophaga]TIA92634.1 hypothetical protein E3P97_01399 [Wallemia ichthyophaga]TIB01780.1 hypothetical protein E3P95_01235 [Wallemia ichthyophaga]TIB02712.1 hypothetical protein E3P94_01367 [Wallemia ichthyophaga]
MSYDDYGNSNPYYEDTGAGGGGFLSNSQGGGYSQGSPSANRKDDDTLRPVTIKQVLNAKQPHADFPFQIEGHDVSHVKLVALVRSIGSQTTSAVYSLEDATGTIDVRYWKDVESESETPGSAHQNQYVRVVGSLKSFANKLQITAQVVKPITDFHEIFYHKAEALAVTLQLRKGTNTLMSESKPSATYGQQSSSEPNYMKPYAEFPPLHKSVMKAIYEESDKSPQGVHVARIAQHCPKGDEALTEAIEYLISEGHLFTGEDDEHILPVTHDS